MERVSGAPAVRIGGWAAVGAAAAVATGSTPMGIAIVAAIGGVLALRTRA
jgi:hypothetical protein